MAAITGILVFDFRSILPIERSTGVDMLFRLRGIHTTFVLIDKKATISNF